MSNPFKTFGISLARAGALASSSRLITDMNWQVRFAANAVFDDVCRASTAELANAADRMARAGRRADIIGFKA